MVLEEPTYVDNLLLSSRFNKSQESSTDTSQKPTSSQKWWIAILLSMIFIIMCSSLAFGVSNGITTKIGFKTYNSTGPTFAGMIIHLIVIALVIRFILW